MCPGNYSMKVVSSFPTTNPTTCWMPVSHQQPHRRKLVVTPEDKRRLVNFLEPSHIAVIATIGPSGAPQLTPNWYCVRDGKILISTTKERVKYRNLVRDNRMSICVYTEATAEDYATVWGAGDDLGRRLHLARYASDR